MQNWLTALSDWDWKVLKMKDRPIGVFDSGVGGLTCAKELLKLVPNENMIYLGDTARMPYGVNTKETLAVYTNDDVDFLQRRDVKLIVVACGTVSSNVPAGRIKNLAVPYIDVISPTISAAVKATKNKRIGIIGTPATIKSGSFAQRLKMYDKDIETVSNGCPQLVTLVEDGYIDEDNFVTNNVCKEYLAPIKAFGVDTLILGCTHFPIISKIIQNIMGDDVTLIDAGYETALEVKKVLKTLSLERTQPRDTVEFYVTDKPEKFDRVANIFLGEGSNARAILKDIKD